MIAPFSALFIGFADLLRQKFFILLANFVNNLKRTYGQFFLVILPSFSAVIDEVSNKIYYDLKIIRNEKVKIELSKLTETATVSKNSKVIISITEGKL